MGRSLTIKEAESRHPDLVKGQIWRGNGTRPPRHKMWYRCTAGLDHPNYLQGFSHHDRGHRCPACWDLRRNKDKVLTLEEVESRHPDMVKGQIWMGDRALYWYNCEEHSRYQLRFDRRQQGRGCQKCGEIRGRILKSLTIEEAEERCPDMVKRQRWVGNSSNYWFLCMRHGQYKQIFGYHDSGSGGCPRCRESKGEKSVVEILTRLSVSFERQYRILECKNVRPLPFDFAVWIYGQIHLIEFQGAQHYRSNGWFGPEAFAKITKTDRIKQEFCISKNIPLLAVPYWEKDIEGLVQRFLGIGEPCPNPASVISTPRIDCSQQSLV